MISSQFALENLEKKNHNVQFQTFNKVNYTIEV